MATKNTIIHKKRKQKSRVPFTSPYLRLFLFFLFVSFCVFCGYFFLPPA
jgi:hypothetical protein